MLPSQLLRENLDEVVKRLQLRGYTFDQDLYLLLEQKRKTIQVELENMQAQRNSLSKAVGQAKAQQQSADGLLGQLNDLKKDMAMVEAEYQSNKTKLIYLKQS